MSISGMEERVPKAWEAANVPEDHRQKRKARLRFARRGALATACLLIGVCVFSVLDPAVLRTASSLFSSTPFDISGVVYPNDASGAPPPPPSDFVNHMADIPPQIADCKTIEEVHATYGLTVYEPTQIPESMKLKEVQANISDGDLNDFSYRYEADEDNMVIFNIQPMPDGVDMSFPEDSYYHTAPVGEFNVWETPSGWQLATAFTKESIMTVRGTLSKDDFLNMLDTLRPVS